MRHLVELNCEGMVYLVYIKKKLQRKLLFSFNLSVTLQKEYISKQTTYYTSYLYALYLNLPEINFYEVDVPSFTLYEKSRIGCKRDSANEWHRHVYMHELVCIIYINIFIIYIHIRRNYYHINIICNI